MAYPGAIVVSDTLRIRGTLSVHGGESSVKRLQVNGLVTESGGHVAFEDLTDFSGTVSGAANARLVFTKQAFDATCDRSGTRLLLDATTTVWLESTCVQAFASIEGNGAIEQSPATSGTIQLQITDGRGIFNGSLAANAPVALECCGTGSQRLGGDLSKALQVDVTGGSLVAEDLTLASGTITNVGNGASFGGFGLLGNVAVNQGTLLMGGGIGNFQSLLFTSSGNATFQVSGADAAAIGQVHTKGVLDLGSASNAGTAGTLSVQFKNGFVPAVGQQLVLFTVASDVQGTFTGLPEGAVANLGGYSFRITYKGGASGHDVVITRQASTSSPTPTATPTSTPPAGGGLKYRRFIPVVGRDG
jgi:hypothetical protein